MSWSVRSGSGVLDSLQILMENNDNNSIEYNDLNDTWTFWVHLPHDINWDINSYKKIYTAEVYSLRYFSCMSSIMDCFTNDAFTTKVYL